MTRHDPGRADAIVSFIEGHIEDWGFAPSIREIARNVGLSSTSGVHHHLRALEKAGRIKRHALASRAIVVAGRSEAEEILFAVMLDRHVAELDAETQDRIGQYFTEHRRAAA